MNKVTTQIQQIEYAVNKFREYILSKSKKALIITRQNMFSFITGGEDNIINISSEYSNVTVVITESDMMITYSVGETGTLNADLLGRAGFKLIPYRFMDAPDRTTFLREIAGTERILSDQPGLFEYCYYEMLTLTQSLTIYEQETYEYLGKYCEKALSKLCYAIKPDMTELEIQAQACSEFLKAGLQPIVFLVGNWRRIHSTRHYMSSAIHAGDRLMIIACIKYRGLILSFTRDIFFRPMKQEEEYMCNKMAHLGALMQVQTLSGKTDLQLNQSYYKSFCQVGLMDAFYEHPSAGYTGYEPRTSWITNTSNLILEDFNAIALNPCINGYKSEDTFIMKNGIPHRISIGVWPDVQLYIEDHIIEKAMPLILL